MYALNFQDNDLFQGGGKPCGRDDLYSDKPQKLKPSSTCSIVRLGIGYGAISYSCLGSVKTPGAAVAQSFFMVRIMLELNGCGSTVE